MWCLSEPDQCNNLWTYLGKFNNYLCSFWTTRGSKAIPPLPKIVMFLFMSVGFQMYALHPIVLICAVPLSYNFTEDKLFCPVYFDLYRPSVPVHYSEACQDGGEIYLNDSIFARIVIWAGTRWTISIKLWQIVGKCDLFDNQLSTPLHQADKKKCNTCWMNWI